MAPVPDSVQSDEELPDSAEVVVIGGGIIGASTALELAERGVDVVLCEKGHIAGEQSSRNWGWCRNSRIRHACDRFIQSMVPTSRVKIRPHSRCRWHSKYPP